MRSVVSVLRPRKSNLTRPAGSTHFMLNWVAGIADFGSFVERHQLDQRPVADDDARGVGRGVGQQAFEPLGDRQHLFDSRVGLGGFLEFWLVGDRLFEGHGLGRVLRHQLGELVDLAERHFEHAPDVAHHAARQKRAEGDDLGDAILAVAMAHIGDHFVAPVLAEVDVEVGHRHAFGIEEALEQEPEAQRIEIGDGERPGDQRPGARAAPGPDRNALRLRPFDEVGDDEEIAGELHLDDHGELELEALDDSPLRKNPARGRSACKWRSRPSCAWRSSSSTSSTASPPGMEKRGRIGFRVSGR